MTWMLITLLLVGLAGCALAVQRHAAAHALLRSSGTRWWSVELRRKAQVCSVPGDLQAYPQPREFRIRVWRLAGMAVWWHGCFVSLPVQCDALIDRLDAGNFDHLFSGAYRFAPRQDTARSGFAPLRQA